MYNEVSVARDLTNSLNIKITYRHYRTYVCFSDLCVYLMTELLYTYHNTKICAGNILRHIIMIHIRKITIYYNYNIILYLYA